jgi:hypothetical protein
MSAGSQWPDGIGLLFPDVARDGFLIVIGVGIDRFNAVNVALYETPNHARQDFGVPHIETYPPAVVIILTGPREVG